MKKKSYVWDRLELTALAVESPRLGGTGVAARIFGREGLDRKFAHNGLRMAGRINEVNATNL
jgi:hypothetical protein